eukprot:11960159-Karenia_brevis.AAC.1
MPSAREECVYRSATKSCSEPKDILSNYPFEGMIKELNDELTTTAEHGALNSIAAGSSNGDDSDDEKATKPNQSTNKSQELMNSSANL